MTIARIGPISLIRAKKVKKPPTVQTTIRPIRDSSTAVESPW